MFSYFILQFHYSGLVIVKAITGGKEKRLKTLTQRSNECNKIYITR